MKIIALIPVRYQREADYLVELSATELAHLRGQHSSDYQPVAVGTEIKINDLWKIITDTKQRTMNLNRGAELLVSIARSIEFAADALDPKPETKAEGSDKNEPS